MQGIKFQHGLPSEHELDHMSDCLIVIDDLMNEAVKDSSLLSTFTEGSHHKNISAVFLMQNIYHKGAHTRTMDINTQYEFLALQHQAVPTRRLHPTSFRTLSS